MFRYLIQSAQVTIVFSCLNISLTKTKFGQLKSITVKLLRLLKKKLIGLMAYRINGNLLQDQGENSLGGSKEQMIMW